MELINNVVLVSGIQQNDLVTHIQVSGGFPDSSGSKESAYNAGKPGFNPWVRKIPWRREWQPTPIFLPGEFHGRGIWRATVHGLGAKRVRHNLVTKQQQQQQQNSSQSKTRFVFKACLLA